MILFQKLKLNRGLVMSSVILIGVVTGVFLYGIYKRVNIFDVFIEGASENIKAAFDILPALVILMTMIAILNVSGVIEVFTGFISPITSIIGFPSECLPLALLRPLSGSGAMSVYESIVSQNHPDSFVGNVASVIMGSTETTFYTVAVYYGAAKIKNIRYTLICALAADISGFIVACVAVRLMM